MAIYVVVGTGGCGKTIVSTSMAKCYANTGMSTLLVNTEHNWIHSSSVNINSKDSESHMINISSGEKMMNDWKNKGIINTHMKTISNHLDVLSLPLLPDNNQKIIKTATLKNMNLSSRDYYIVIVDCISSQLYLQKCLIKMVDKVIFVANDNVISCEYYKLLMEHQEKNNAVILVNHPYKSCGENRWWLNTDINGSKILEFPFLDNGSIEDIHRDGEKIDINKVMDICLSILAS